MSLCQVFCTLHFSCCVGLINAFKQRYSVELSTKHVHAIRELAWIYLIHYFGLALSISRSSDLKWGDYFHQQRERGRRELLVHVTPIRFFHRSSSIFFIANRPSTQDGFIFERSWAPLPKCCPMRAFLFLHKLVGQSDSTFHKEMWSASSTTPLYNKQSETNWTEDIYDHLEAV